MDIRVKAFQIIYDIIGIVLRWDKHQLSDKEAMEEIVDILSSQVENGEFYPSTKKKKYNLFPKKFISPVIIGSIFAVILLVVFPLGVFSNLEPQLPAEKSNVGFKQLEERHYNVTEIIPNNSTMENFGNITNFGG